MESENNTEKVADGAQAQPAPFTPLGTKEASPEAGKETYLDQGWSWGGFMLSWKFAIAIKEYKYLFFLILLCVPFVNFIVLIGMMVYFGVKGRELARASRMFANHEQYLGFMKGMDHLGKVMVYIALVVGFVVLLLVSIIFTAFFKVRHSAEDVFQQQSYEIQQMVDQRDMR